MTGLTLLISLAMGAKYYALKEENVKKCIRMGITVLKKCHLGRENRRFYGCKLRFTATH